jgi:hypothetical protein
MPEASDLSMRLCVPAPILLLLQVGTRLEVRGTPRQPTPNGPSNAQSHHLAYFADTTFSKVDI